MSGTKERFRKEYGNGQNNHHMYAFLFAVRMYKYS